MLEFLTIAVFAFMGILMAFPVTLPLFAGAFLLGLSTRRQESVNDVTKRRCQRWYAVLGIPSLMIVFGGAVAANYRGILDDELAIWLLFWLLCQLFLAAVGCWWCQPRWRSALSAALSWGTYSIGASLAGLLSSLTHL